MHPEESTVHWFKLINCLVVNSVKMGIGDITYIHPALINSKDSVFRLKKVMDERVRTLKAVELRVVDDVLVIGNKRSKDVCRID